MKKGAYVKGRILSIIGAVTALFVMTGGVCYAANVGGIRETVQLWIHGNSVEATIEESENQGFTVSYEDENGLHEFAGGGMAEDEDGTMRPVTMEEYLEYLNTDITAETDEEGHVWLYCQDQAIDITDQFNICQTVIERNGEKVWVHVTKNAEGEIIGVQSSAEPFDTWVYEDEPEDPED